MVKPRVVLGIDPGVQGALAALALDGSLLHVGALPRLRKTNDLAGTLRILQEIAERAEVVAVGLELVAMGARLVRHAGQLEGLLVACGWQCTRIPAFSWQRNLPVPKGKENQRERKEMLARLAAERWPTIDVRRVKDWGNADAAWIADHARVKWLSRRGSLALA